MSRSRIFLSEISRGSSPVRHIKTFLNYEWERNEDGKKMVIKINFFSFIIHSCHDTQKALPSGDGGTAAV
jgi:hypothetical protein